LREETIEPGSDVDLGSAASGRGDFRQLIELGLDAASQQVRIEAAFLEQRSREAAFLRQHRNQEMLYVNLLMTLESGQTLRRSQGFLCFLCKTV
jgi:hypothetical protein